MVVDLLTFLQACCQSAVCLEFSFRWSKEQQAQDKDQRAQDLVDFLFPGDPEILGQIGRSLGHGCFGTVYELRRLKPRVPKDGVKLPCMERKP